MRSNAAITDHSSGARRHAASEERWPLGAALAVVLAAVASIGATALLERWFSLDGALVWRAAGLALGGGCLLLWLVWRRLRTPTFGRANRVTLLRAGLVTVLFALLGAPVSAPLAWVAVALATVAAVLDGFDGRLARRHGESTDFGARFDMETDALSILVLALLVWQFGKADVWILLAGLLRYLFVALGYVWPRLQQPLPPSRRRQTVCVLQIVSLIAALAPFIVPPWSGAVALLGLAVLMWSFAVDVVWLARRTNA